MPHFLRFGKAHCAQSTTKHTRRETQPADKPAGGHMQNRRQRNVPAGVDTEARPCLLLHISEPTRQAEISYAVFCLKKKKTNNITRINQPSLQIQL